LAVNLLGNPNDFNAFPRKCHILEDNCESLGAEYDGRKTGSFGLMASHSTFFSHHICTMEGGVVTTNDEYLYQMLLCLRSHGWTRHLPEKNVFGVKPGKFDFLFPGFNVRPTEIQAAIGIEQLKKLPKIIEVRRDNAKRFPLKTQKEIGKSSWFGFAVFEGDVDRVSQVAETRPVVTGNFLRSPSIKYYDYEVFGPTPNADYIHDHACFIGNNGERIDWSCLNADLKKQ
jgi:CDP-6-deoxy-D-xylo-4-hexulose-3-dehydrase